MATKKKSANKKAAKATAPAQKPAAKKKAATKGKSANKAKENITLPKAAEKSPEFAAIQKQVTDHQGQTISDAELISAMTTIAKDGKEDDKAELKALLVRWGYTVGDLS